ncbi:MAG TPA: DUF1850 domain-containing protein [Casimicrobiaceae bacterium]|nr:DUF1850 domain-containing protein [Casimicrobiaceae bacterium]
MNAACLFVAGALRVVVPAHDFTVAWMHSVARTAWEEHYRVEGSGLRLVQARIQGSGAGMEPPPDAQFREGWWTWRPSLAPLPEIRLTLSSFTRDYDLCWDGRCRRLSRLVAPRHSHARAKDPPIAEGTVVEIRACAQRHE